MSHWSTMIHKYAATSQKISNRVLIQDCVCKQQPKDYRCHLHHLPTSRHHSEAVRSIYALLSVEDRSLRGLLRPEHACRWMGSTRQIIVDVYCKVCITLTGWSSFPLRLPIIRDHLKYLTHTPPSFTDDNGAWWQSWWPMKSQLKVCLREASGSVMWHDHSSDRAIEIRLASPRPASPRNLNQDMT